jgi:hypothetical protein
MTIYQQLCIEQIETPTDFIPSNQDFFLTAG